MKKIIFFLSTLILVTNIHGMSASEYLLKAIRKHLTADERGADWKDTKGYERITDISDNPLLDEDKTGSIMFIDTIQNGTQTITSFTFSNLFMKTVLSKNGIPIVCIHTKSKTVEGFGGYACRGEKLVPTGPSDSYMSPEGFPCPKCIALYESNKINNP